MGLPEDLGNLPRQPVPLEGLGNRRAIGRSRVASRKPMPGVPHQIVAHLPPGSQIQPLGISPKTKEFLDVHLARYPIEVRHAVECVRAPLWPENPLQLRVQPRHDRSNGRGGVFVMSQRRHVRVKVRGARGPDAEGVNLGFREAVRICG